MKTKLLHIFFTLVLACLFFSCEDEKSLGTVYKDDYSTIYSFLEENENFSAFKQIVDSARINSSEQTLKVIYSSFNHHVPGNRGYTLFLPDNAAVEEYLQEENLSLDELLADNDECWGIAAHHLILSKTYKKNFTNGVLPDTSLNGEQHTIRFSEHDNRVDYLIDERASVVDVDIEKSNGIIHTVDKMLIRLSQTSGEWLKDNPDYSIFYQALVKTGWYDYLQDIDTRLYPFTLLVEADSIFANESIYSLADLENYLMSHKTSEEVGGDELYDFVGYHIIDERLSFADWDASTSGGNSSSEIHNTFADYPLRISIAADLSLGDQLLNQVGINDGLVAFDTIITPDQDTTFTDHISVFEASSNMPTLSGVMHFINALLEVNAGVSPSNKYFNFREDAYINAYFEYRSGWSVALTEEELERFSFSGDVNWLSYYWTDEGNGAHDGDYIYFSGGNYSISYRTPKFLEGNYTLRFKFEVSNSSGFFNVYVDDVKVGATINIASKDPDSYGYNLFDVGDVFIEGYKEHTVTIKSVTPCRIYWDYIHFKPF